MKNFIYKAENHPQSEPWCVIGTEFHIQIQVEQHVFENLWSTSVPVTADSSFSTKIREEMLRQSCLFSWELMFIFNVLTAHGLYQVTLQIEVM